MKTKNQILLVLASLLAAGSMFGQPVVTTITSVDTYFGGNPGGSDYDDRDVVGAPGNYNLTAATTIITRKDTGLYDLTVKIYGNYFDNIGSDGTGLGDLFISTDVYTPSIAFGEPAKFISDTAYTGEIWEYGFRVGSSATGSVKTLNTLRTGDLVGLNTAEQASDYFRSLPSTNPDADITLSHAGATFRNQQEVLVTPGQGTPYKSGEWIMYSNPDKVGSDVTASSSNANNLKATADGPGSLVNDNIIETVLNKGPSAGSHVLEVRLTDLPGWFLNVVNGKTEGIAFHYAMTCANDVIEWSIDAGTPVPEPAAVALVSLLGLGGFLYLRRRKVAQPVIAA